MKRGVLLLVLILALPVVNADPDSWLINESKDELGTLGVLELSFVSLATADNPTESKIYLDALDRQKDSSGCYPKGDCTVLETAVATYAKRILNGEVQDSIEWLDSAKKQSPIQGKWLLQIESNVQTSCTLKSPSKTMNVTILEDRLVLECDDYFVDLNTCAQMSFPTNDIEVTCDEQGVTISLLRSTGDSTYYLEGQYERPSVTLSAVDVCYGREKNSPDCHADSTAWTLLALDETEFLSTSNPFLDSEASTPLHYFALRAIQQDEQSLDELSPKLLEDGSFEDDGYQTALAYLALKGSSLEKAASVKTWLEDELGENGIDGKILDTAAALYALEGTPFIPTGTYCGDGIINSPGEECDGASDDSCPGRCGSSTSLQACKCPSTGGGEDGGGDSTESPVDDTPTRDEDEDAVLDCRINRELFTTCDCGGEEVSSGRYCCEDEDGVLSPSSKSCDKGGGGVLKIILWITLPLLIIIIMLIIAKRKGWIRGRKQAPSQTRDMQMPRSAPQPRFEPAIRVQQRSHPPIRHGPEDQIESQLDKSIEEAKRLLSKRR